MTSNPTDLIERLRMLQERANADGAETADRFAYRSELELHAPALFNTLTQQESEIAKMRKALKHIAKAKMLVAWDSGPSVCYAAETAGIARAALSTNCRWEKGPVQSSGG